MTKPAKRCAAIAGAAAALAALALLAVFLFLPMAQYAKARRLAQAGSLAAAYELFEQLGEFRDAPAQKAALQRAAAASRSQPELEFAGQTWLVLEERGGQKLLLLQGVLGEMPYHTALEDVTWETCSLRRYLNGAYLESLPAQARARIVSPGGDAVFLLSAAEAALYLPGEAARMVRFAGTGVYWWLRTQGSKPYLAAVVSATGEIGLTGSGVDYAQRYVRPALWVLAEEPAA